MPLPIVNNNNNFCQPQKHSISQSQSSFQKPSLVKEYADKSDKSTPNCSDSKSSTNCKPPDCEWTGKVCKNTR